MAKMHFVSDSVPGPKPGLKMAVVSQVERLNKQMDSDKKALKMSKILNISLGLALLGMILQQILS